MTEAVQIETVQALKEENAALRIQLKKLERQFINQQNTMMRFEKISTTRDGLAAKLKE
jgi:hypothetical protein